MKKITVEKEVLLEKFPGKGGWTYARIPEIPQDAKAPFGWVKVKGKIDNFTFQQVKLMPMGNGQLFFPVKASIRKAIGKQAGDNVYILLELDNDPIITPEEMIECLQDEPQAWEYYQKLSEGQQKAYIDWIEAAKTDETKVQRLAQMVEECKKGESLSKN